MPNPVLNQSARQKNVANMLATLRIEKLSPSESLRPSLQAYVDGQKTTTDLLNEVKAKYVALRRGWCLLHPRHCCSQEQSWNNWSKPAWWVWRWLYSHSSSRTYAKPSRRFFRFKRIFAKFISTYSKTFTSGPAKSEAWTSSGAKVVFATFAISSLTQIPFLVLSPQRNIWST